MIRDRIAEDLGNMTRAKLKRDTCWMRSTRQYSFESAEQAGRCRIQPDLPALDREMKRSNQTFAAEGTTEEEAREEYRNCRAACPPRTGSRDDRRAGGGHHQRRGDRAGADHPCPSVPGPGAQGLRVLQEKSVGDPGDPRSAVRAEGHRPHRRTRQGHRCNDQPRRARQADPGRRGFRGSAA